MKINRSPQHVSTCLILIMFFVISYFTGEATVFSQSYIEPVSEDLPSAASLRPNGGWVPSPRQEPMFSAGGSLPPHEDSAVQHASYFQTQGMGGFPPPPVYPPTGGEDVNVQSGLRRRDDPIPPGSQGTSAAGGLQASSQFETGLPFVTAAPITQPNPGRYPTSPYMGPRVAIPYQNAGYQRVIPVQSGTTHTAAPAGVLPQYQTASYQNPVFSNNPSPGIYPTSYQQCQVLPPPSLPPDGLSGQTYIPPTFTPNWNPNMYSNNNVGHRPLFTLGQENHNVVLGRGIIGQPKAYVPGQGIRNFLRYLTP